MSLALQKIILAGTNTSVPGSTFKYANVTCGIGNATAGLATVIPAGIGWILNTTNVNIELNTPTGNGAVNSWTFVGGNATSGLGFMYISDGQNLRANAATSTQTITVVTINPGSEANVSGTFNNV